MFRFCCGSEWKRSSFLACTGAAVAVLISTPALGELPKLLEMLLLQNADEVVEILKPLKEAQRELVLKRLVEQMTDGEYGHGKGVKPEELKRFVYHLLENHYQSPPCSPEVRVKSDLRKVAQHSLELANRTEPTLKRLVEKFSGTFRDGTVSLKFECGPTPDRKITYELPFSVTADPEENGPRLTLEGISLGSDDRRCLDIALHPNGTSHIFLLATQLAACPLPAEQAGNCLLQVAEQMSSAVGSKEMELIDASQVYCPAVGKAISLQTLKIFQEGQSWYQKYGFKTRTPEMYEDLIEPFRQFSMAILATSIQAATEKALERQFLAKMASEKARLEQRYVALKGAASKEDPGLKQAKVPESIVRRYFGLPARFEIESKKGLLLRQRFLESLTKYRQVHPLTTLSDFMNWLFKEGCGPYSEAIDFLLLPEAQLPVSELAPIGIDFYKPL